MSSWIDGITRSAIAGGLRPPEVREAPVGQEVEHALVRGAVAADRLRVTIGAERRHDASGGTRRRRPASPRRRTVPIQSVRRRRRYRCPSRGMLHVGLSPRDSWYTPNHMATAGGGQQSRWRRRSCAVDRCVVAEGTSGPIDATVDAGGRLLAMHRNVRRALVWLAERTRRFVPHELYRVVYGAGRLGYFPNYVRPRTLNEKVTWWFRNSRDPRLSQRADKLAVRALRGGRRALGERTRGLRRGRRCATPSRSTTCPRSRC